MNSPPTRPAPEASRWLRWGSKSKFAASPAQSNNLRPTSQHRAGAILPGALPLLLLLRHRRLTRNSRSKPLHNAPTAPRFDRWAPLTPGRPLTPHAVRLRRKTEVESKLHRRMSSRNSEGGSVLVTSSWSRGRVQAHPGLQSIYKFSGLLEHSNAESRPHPRTRLRFLQNRFGGSHLSYRTAHASSAPMHRVACQLD